MICVAKSVVDYDVYIGLSLARNGDQYFLEPSETSATKVSSTRGIV